MKIFCWIGSAWWTVIALIEGFSYGIDAFYAPALLACIFLVLANQEELQEKMKK